MSKQETLQEQQMREQVEYQNCLNDIRTVLGTAPGKRFMLYLLKSLNYGDFPPPGFPENMLQDRLGFLRAGQSIFEMIVQAHPDHAGDLAAIIAKERYVQK